MKSEEEKALKDLKAKERLSNYWDLGDKTAAEHFTRDFCNYSAYQAVSLIAIARKPIYG